MAACLQAVVVAHGELKYLALRFRERGVVDVIAGVAVVHAVRHICSRGTAASQQAQASQVINDPVNEGSQVTR